MYTLTIALLAHSHTPLVKMTIKKQVKTLMSLRSVTYTEIIEIVSGNKTIDEKNKHENEMLAFVKCAENTLILTTLAPVTRNYQNSSGRI